MTDSEAKYALRRKMRAARKEQADCLALDERIFRRFTALPIYQNAPCILCYVRYGTEADTRKILETALSNGKAVYVPRCIPNSNRMVFCRIFSLKDLVRGAYGIMEPSENDTNEYYEDTPNALCIVPGLAFSPNGARLGYGKGYYDTFFAQHRILKIGLCYDFQLVPQIPMQPHDVYMDGILTDRTFLSGFSAEQDAPKERME